jgi:ring-1,2-phenylacetyl-CoA epoxidase subunit PaaD
VSGAAAASAGPSAAAREAQAWAILGELPDPEIPVLSLVDLGIVRYVRAAGEGLYVGLTPTYSGCPATEIIRAQVQAALAADGFAAVHLEEVLSPPWSSAWLSEGGRAKLRAFGIAPPEEPVASVRALWQSPQVRCPRCASASTERVSEFGSTPCKAHYRCLACGEPFDYFKCL